MGSEDKKEEGDIVKQFRVGGPSVAILALWMLTIVKRNNLHPTMRNLCDNCAF